MIWFYKSHQSKEEIRNNLKLSYFSNAPLYECISKDAAHLLYLVLKKARQKTCYIGEYQQGGSPGNNK